MDESDRGRVMRRKFVSHIIFDNIMKNETKSPPVSVMCVCFFDVRLE